MLIAFEVNILYLVYNYLISLHVHAHMGSM